MHEALISYFTGEKQGGLWFLGTGIVALAIGGWVCRHPAWYRAILYPLLIVGMIQAGAGLVLQLRTNSQAARLEKQLFENPAEYKAGELSRLEKTMLGFRVFKVCWLLMIAAGVFLAYRSPAESPRLAVGIGLIAQGAAMLVLDLFAESRAQIYAEAIREMG
ncbi:MAG: hypothetical protein AB1405_02285 [Bdellovibrionota bacterium]